jgi:hypothetical protein
VWTASRIALSVITILAQTNVAMPYVPPASGIGCHVHNSYPGHVVFLDAGRAVEVYWSSELVVNQYRCSTSSCYYMGADNGIVNGMLIVMSFSEDMTEIEFQINATINGAPTSSATRENVTCSQS